MKTGKELYEIWTKGAKSYPTWELLIWSRKQRWNGLADTLNYGPIAAEPTPETDLLDARVTALENNDLLESRVKALEEIVTKYRPSYEEVRKMVDTVQIKVGDKVLFNWVGVGIKGTVGCFPGPGWVTVDGGRDYTGYTFRVDDP